MYVKPEIEKLPCYIRHYVKEVIGVAWEVLDHPEPAVIKSPEPKIYLPLSIETLGKFLGKGFVRSAPVELLFSIVIGLAYHEVAHLLSGEKKTKPWRLNNLLCDSNDFNFVPQRWKGSIPFTLSLTNAWYRQGKDVAQIPVKTDKEKLRALVHLAITYLRKLRVKYGGQDVRALPQDHPLFQQFEQIKPIVRRARRYPVKRRPELVKELYQVFKEFWDQDEKPDFKDVELELKEELSSKDAKELSGSLKSSGAGTKIQEELRRVVIEVERIAAKEIEKEAQKAIRRIEHWDKKNSTRPEVEINTEDVRPAVFDQGIVRALRKSLKPLLFERSLARRRPGLKGTKFCPQRFYQIKTNPQRPAIRKEIIRIGRAVTETEILLCFDRSGSMLGEKEEITKEVAATLYVALLYMPQARLQILGFNDQGVLIKGDRAQSKGEVLKRISAGLSARGGTDFPLVLREGIKLLQRAKAHKKICFMLTDGDLEGELSVPDLLLYARRHRIGVFVFGVAGSRPEELKEIFGRESVIYVQRIEELPAEVKRLALKRL